MPIFSGSAAQLGGPLQAVKQPTKIGGFYENMYGTSVSGGYDPLRNSGDVSIQVPIGDYNSGYYGGVSGGYNPQQGFNAGIRIGKKRNTAPQSEDKFTYGFGLNQEPPMRFAGQIGIPGVLPAPEGTANYGPPGSPAQNF